MGNNNNLHGKIKFFGDWKTKFFKLRWISQLIEKFLRLNEAESKL